MKRITKLREYVKMQLQLTSLIERIVEDMINTVFNTDTEFNYRNPDTWVILNYVSELEEILEHKISERVLVGLLDVDKDDFLPEDYCSLMEERHPEVINNPETVALLESPAVKFELLKNVNGLQAQFDRFRADFTQFINGTHPVGTLNQNDSYYFTVFEEMMTNIKGRNEIINRPILKIRLSNHQPGYKIKQDMNQFSSNRFYFVDLSLLSGKPKYENEINRLTRNTKVYFDLFPEERINYNSIKDATMIKNKNDKLQNIIKRCRKMTVNISKISPIGKIINFALTNSGLIKEFVMSENPIEVFGRVVKEENE